MARIQVVVTKEQIHRLNALVLVCVLSAFVSVVYAERTAIPQGRNFGMALPGEKCRVSPLPKWTEPEKWVWIQICEGKEANFNERFKEKLDPRNPAHDDRWSNDRILTSSFLETILLYEPFRSAIPRQGVRIIGAYFPNSINLTDASIERPLVLYKSRFNSQVDMHRLRTPMFISFQGSKFDSDLNMDSISVGGSLFLRNAECGEVNLKGAEIGKYLDMDGSTFKGKLVMDSVSVGVNLFMRKAECGEAILKGAEISNQLSLGGSTFKGKLDMDSISTGDSLFMRRRAEFGEVILRGAKIGGQLNTDGSTFKGKLIMYSVSVDDDLLMINADFNEVDLRGAKVSKNLDTAGSTFKGKLIMDSVSVDDLFMTNAKFGEVDLRGAKIDDYLGLNGSIFKGKLIMDSVSVDDLFMTNAKFGEVDLRGAKIDDYLGLNGSIFKGKLIMDSVSVDDLFMTNAKFGEVDLRGAKIDDYLGLNGSIFKGKLIMDSVSIGGSLFMTNTKFDKPANLMFLRVGSNLDVRIATLRGLDLTSSRIEGELRLGSSNVPKINWKVYRDKNENSQAPKLTLRNTSVGALQDTKDTWPNHLEREFEGFTYDRLGGFGASEQEKPAERGSSWFIEWLAKDESYSPQPYRHLAGVLRATGHEDMADDILVASRDRELEESKPSQFKWWRLWILKIFIGYGYGWGYLCALVWSVLLVVAGTFIPRFAKEGNKDSIKLGFWYSLDILLPIIHLRERHYTDVDLDTWAKYYFYFHKIMGYVLISFVLAGLSGLVE